MLHSKCHAPSLACVLCAHSSYSCLPACTQCSCSHIEGHHGVAGNEEVKQTSCILQESITSTTWTTAMLRCSKDEAGVLRMWHGSRCQTNWCHHHLALSVTDTQPVMCRNAHTTARGPMRCPQGRLHMKCWPHTADGLQVMTALPS